MTATANVVETRGLTKAYGPTLALVDLDLEVRRAEILGFLGPNGAGKTTVIRLLLGLLRASRGSAKVFGLDAWSQSVAVRQKVGYLPGDARLYESLTGQRFLQLFDRLRGGGSSYEPLAERLVLDLRRRIRGYSKGMKQKLGLIQALMHDPELIILDEPTSALDPLVQEEVYTLLRERRAGGRTVFFSSHVLPEVQKVCDRVAIVRSGRLLKLQTIDELRDLELRQARVRVKEMAACASVLMQAGYRVLEEDGWLSVQVPEIDAFVKLLARFEVVSLNLQPLTVEEVFLELYRDGSVEPADG